MISYHKLAKKNIIKLPYPGPMAHIQSHNELSEKKIFLDNNTNAFGGAYKYYPNILQNKLKQQYLDFIWELDQKKHLTKKHDNPLTSNNIIFTTGAVDALDLVLKAFAEPGVDQTIITPPTFSAFYHWNNIYHLDTIQIPLQENGSKLIVPDILGSEAKLLLLCDPNNPLGTRICPDSLNNILVNFKQLIIIDEAYVEFSLKHSALGSIDKNQNLIILRTCSKALGMAGLRVGAIISDEKIINTLKRVQPPYNMPTPVCTLLKDELNHSKSLYLRIEKICNERERVLSAISNSNLVKKIYSSETNFLCIEFHDLSVAKDKFSTARIQIIWEPEGLHNTARITLGNADENNLLINVLKD